MALAITNLIHEADTGGGDPDVTAGSITTVADRLYLVSVQVSGNPVPAINSITLPGTVSLTEIANEVRGVLFRVACYYGIASAGGTGTISVDQDVANTGSVISVAEVTGHNATTPVITANFVKSNNTDATAPTDIALTLPNALTNSDNMILMAAGSNTNTTWTPGTDYTELGDAGHNVPTRSMATEYDITPVDLVADGSFVAAVQWAAIAYEVNVASAVTVIPSLLAAPYIAA